MNECKFSTFTLVFILILSLTACSNNSVITALPMVSETAESDATRNPIAAIAEYDLIEIPLPKELASASMEYSGLAWYDDDLVLLPQFPNGIRGNQDGFLYSISWDSLEEFLKDPTTTILTNEIPFDDAGISKQLDGFEGFEAILFIKNSVYLTIETHGGNPMKSFVVRGAVEIADNEIRGIKLDQTSLVELPVQNDNSNASYEALTSDGEYVYAFFEQNGEDQNDHPYAVRLDTDLKNWKEIPVDAVNYRLTDATLMDDDGGFWMINYFYPGDKNLAVDQDPISTRYGLGESHQRNKPIERLVRFSLSQERFVLDSVAPIYLKLLEQDEARNWEGLATFGENGFFLITDKFPDSILGFIKIR